MAAGSLLSAILRVVRERRGERRLHAAFQQNRALHNLYAIFRHSPEARYIIGKNDAVELHERIRSLSPKRILELGGGSGCATAVMALALPAGAQIISVEQWERCVALAKRLIPPQLQEKIRFFFSPPEVFEDQRAPFMRFAGYRDLPLAEGPFDFVLIDGPGDWQEGGKTVKLPAGDLFRLLPSLAPGAAIFVDGRKMSARYYKKFLRTELTVVEETDDHTVFQYIGKR